MRRIPGLPALLLIAQLAFLIPTGAEDEFKALVSAYNAHEYQKAARYGESFIRKQPGNAEARYYLANSYMQLKQLDLASIQYRRCQELAPNSRLAENSSLALRDISRYLSPPRATFHPSKKKHGKNHAAPGSPQEQQIWNDAQDRIHLKEEDANRQISDIRQQAQQDIASVPKKIRRRRRNPDYAPNKADINAQASAKIAKIKEALAHDKRDILHDADDRISSLRK